MRMDKNAYYRVAAYERLSREDDRKDESASIESQKMIIESFAKFQNFKIIKHYADDGYTGSNFDRPNFEALKQDIEAGLINCVIVKDLSRLGRELYETGIYIEEYFLQKKVRFIAINDGYDSEVGDAMLGIRLSVNDLYLRDTSKKIRSSFDAKRKRGDYIGSFAKFGYQKNPDNPKQLILDEYAASIVAHMFQWMADGMGSSKIAHRLTQQGVPIPSIYKKENRTNMQKELNEGKGIWRPQTVLGIVTDKMYLGHMVQGRWKKLSYHSKKLIELPESEWIIVKNTHPAIVTQELFDRVQQEVKKNKKYQAKGEKTRLFQGLLYCKECGHSIGITKRKLKHGTSSFTVCNHFAKYSKYGICSAHRLNYDFLEKDLLDYLRKIGECFLQDCRQEEWIQAGKNLQRSDKIALEKQLENIQKEITKKQNRLMLLYEDRLQEVISVKQYKIMATKYENQVIELEKAKKQITEQLDTLEDEMHKHSYETCKKQFVEYMKFAHPTQELMYQIVDKIVIDKEKKVEVFLRADILRYAELLAQKDASDRIDQQV